jgi:hypothetical protein
MSTAYQLRIELRDFKPAIYRDVLVDPATPLPKLHKLIQSAMGWEDVHLHGFAVPLKNEHYDRVHASRRFEKPKADGCASVGYDKSQEDHAVALQMFGDQQPGWLDFEALQKAVKRRQPKLRLHRAQSHS